MQLPSVERIRLIRFDPNNLLSSSAASQPPCRGGGRGGGALRHTGPRGAGGGSGGGDGRSPVHPGSRPLRDLSLRGLKVTSSTASSSSNYSLSPSSGESSGAAAGAARSNYCNGRLGLVAAASQLQGKRASQEDRVTVAADLVTALAGKVCDN